MFTENFAAAADKRLLVTSTSRRLETIVVVEAAAFRRTLILPAGATRVVLVPARLQASGVGRATVGIALRATAPVAVVGVNTEVGRSGAYAAMTDAALGFNYRAMAWWPASGEKHVTQLAVVAPEDGTIVTVTPVAGRGIRFEYGGATYEQGVPLTVTLNRLETLQVD